ncbi:late embryogenesis abundant protein [Striga asiatica]|uniref:Late embryogenesis abundant protein n=1 Tax=Striga asiatica TaxID=4170 RepID=A0A5A7PKG1_STRAF|nr:late embryogenesis abundant protein [Striga asiatica]
MMWTGLKLAADNSFYVKNPENNEWGELLRKSLQEKSHSLCCHCSCKNRLASMKCWKSPRIRPAELVLLLLHGEENAHSKTEGFAIERMIKDEVRRKLAPNAT